MTRRKIRVAVVNSHPIQYFAPLYAYISASEDIEITAIYLSDFSVRGGEDKGFGQVIKWDVDLLAGYKYRFVEKASQNGQPLSLFALSGNDIWNIVREEKFDALWLHGHNMAPYLLAMAAAKSIGSAVLMRSETHLGLRLSPSKELARRVLLGAFYKTIDGFLAIGSANKSFYRAMGVPEDKISIVPYTVDNERFTRVSTLTPQERVAVRQKLGASPDRPLILYASKFMRRKHPDDLMRACRKLADEGIEFDLVMVGSGEMDTELKSMAASVGPKNTLFPGFINQQELPRVFGASDVFVLPSEDEPWGLIVNEAMNAGLPVVLSAEIGCVPDLLRDGQNGHWFQAGDVDGLAAALRPIVSDPSIRAAMSQKSREIISGWSYQQCLEGLREQLDRIERRRGRRFVS